MNDIEVKIVLCYVWQSICADQDIVCRRHKQQHINLAQKEKSMSGSIKESLVILNVAKPQLPVDSSLTHATPGLLLGWRDRPTSNKLSHSDYCVDNNARV